VFDRFIVTILTDFFLEEPIGLIQLWPVSGSPYPATPMSAWGILGFFLLRIFLGGGA